MSDLRCSVRPEEGQPPVLHIGLPPAALSVLTRRQITPDRRQELAVRWYRDEGWTQQQIAAELGMSQYTVSQDVRDIIGTNNVSDRRDSLGRKASPGRPRKPDPPPEPDPPAPPEPEPH